MLTFKILFIGDNSVGKTTLFKKIVQNEKNKEKIPSLKAEIVKVYRTIQGEEVTFELYDLPARELLSSPQRTKWYLGTDGAFIVFDITKAETFRRVTFWLEQLINYNRKGKIPIVLVGNKIDMRDNPNVRNRTLNPIDAQAFCLRLNRTSAREGINNEFFEVSAISGKGLTQLLDALAKNIYNHYKTMK